jgi:hypothetical protein
MSVAPAMAETFPSNGLMQENKTYDNAATSTNMDGVYEGTVNAIAEYDIIDYIVNAGQYLPADSETVITCPAGSFCPGISGNVQYNQSASQGIQTCPTGYASSVVGASSDTQCYRQCSGNVTIAHATGVTGNDYYGNGTDTCEPTACENGYHVGGLDVVFKTPIVPIDYNDVANSYGYIPANGRGGRNYTNYGLTNNNTWAAEYEDGTIVSGRASCQSSATPDNMAVLYIMQNISAVMSGDMEFSELKAGVAQLVGDAKANWVENVFNQMMTGQLTEAQALTKVLGMFGINENANYTTSSTGQYCYCQLDGYIPNGGTLQAVSAPWVFAFTRDVAIGCADNCALYCGNSLVGGYSSSNSLAFRAAMLGAIESSPSMCEANTIKINWSDAAQTDIDANNAGTVTYGSDVRTPVKAQTIKGKTFKGWRFSKPEQTTTGNNG